MDSERYVSRRDPAFNQDNQAPLIGYPSGDPWLLVVAAEATHESQRG